MREILKRLEHETQLIIENTQLKAQIKAKNESLFELIEICKIHFPPGEQWDDKYLRKAEQALKGRASPERR